VLYVNNIGMLNRLAGPWLKFNGNQKYLKTYKLGVVLLNFNDISIPLRNEQPLNLTLTAPGSKLHP